VRRLGLQAPFDSPGAAYAGRRYDVIGSSGMQQRTLFDEQMPAKVARMYPGGFLATRSSCKRSDSLFRNAGLKCSGR